MVRSAAVGVPPVDVLTVPCTIWDPPPANACGKKTNSNAIKRLENSNTLFFNIFASSKVK